MPAGFVGEVPDEGFQELVGSGLVGGGSPHLVEVPEAETGDVPEKDLTVFSEQSVDLGGVVIGEQDLQPIEIGHAAPPLCVRRVVGANGDVKGVQNEWTGAVGALVEQLFAPAVPRLRLARVLWERSRGNPGFIAEILRGLVERGQARPTPAGLDLVVHPDDLPLPASLRGAVTEAYACLGRKERTWLSRLAEYFDMSVRSLAWQTGLAVALITAGFWGGRTTELLRTTPVVAEQQSPIGGSSLASFNDMPCSRAIFWMRRVISAA